MTDFPWWIRDWRTDCKQSDSLYVRPYGLILEFILASKVLAPPQDLAQTGKLTLSGCIVGNLFGEPVAMDTDPAIEASLSVGESPRDDGLWQAITTARFACRVIKPQTLYTRLLGRPNDGEFPVPKYAAPKNLEVSLR